MTNFLWGILVGATIVDFAWGWKMGIPQLFWSKLRHTYRRVSGWYNRQFGQ